MIKLLHPDQAWQPKLGAPVGNRNAFKTGKHTVALVDWRKRVASWRRRVRAAFAAAPITAEDLWRRP